MSVINSSLNVISATVDRAVDLFGRSVSKAFAFVLIGGMCLIMFAGQVIRAHHALPPEFFLPVFLTLLLLWLLEFGGLMGMLLVGGDRSYIFIKRLMIAPTIGLLGILLFTFMPKSIMGGFVIREKIDADNLAQAKQAAISIVRLAPCSPTADFFGRSPDGKKVALVYVAHRDGKPLCSSKDGLDPETGDPLEPITSELVQEIKQQATLIALTAPPPAPVATPAPVVSTPMEPREHATAVAVQQVETRPNTEPVPQIVAAMPVAPPTLIPISILERGMRFTVIPREDISFANIRPGTVLAGALQGDITQNGIPVFRDAADVRLVVLDLLRSQDGEKAKIILGVDLIALPNNTMQPIKAAIVNTPTIEVAHLGRTSRTVKASALGAAVGGFLGNKLKRGRQGTLIGAGSGAALGGGIGAATAQETPVLKTQPLTFELLENIRITRL